MEARDGSSIRWKLDPITTATGRGVAAFPVTSRSARLEGMDAHSEPFEGDPGLFGPASVTWQMHGDPMMWIAGVRALYLQALHPRAVRGVMQNSDFRKDAWGRLMRTADFVGTITYGTTEAAEQAGARVRKIHRLLSATDPDTGERYGVDEPELLLWVHCAEIDSYLHVLRRSGFPLTDAQADRYVDEHRVSARLVGLDPADVPGDTGRARRLLREGPPRARRRARGARRRRLPAPAARPTRCSSRRANCCGGAWRSSRTPPCRRTPTSCTAGPRPAPRTRHPPPARSPAPCCAAFPPVCAGSSRPGTS